MAAYAEQVANDDRVGVASFVVEQSIPCLEEVAGCAWVGQNNIDIIHKLRSVLRDIGIEDLADNALLVGMKNLTGRMRVKQAYLCS